MQTIYYRLNEKQRKQKLEYKSHNKELFSKL